MSAPVEPGQFDDAPEDGANTAAVIAPQAPRDGHSYIDEHLAWSSSSEDDEDEDELELEEAEDMYTRAEDEDWEITERDFTKQYNRLRQHLAVHSGTAQGVASSVQKSTSVAPLPAVNRPSKSAPTKDKTSDQLAALVKYSSRLAGIDTPYELGVGVNRKGPSSYANQKDKSDRATNEQVLDPRTRIILFKMIGRGLVHEVNGCVSTGKEANVYHALTPESTHLALKIYKTSILVFKDRDKYVTGEYRFRRGYSRRNPRKMVRLWAEKEMRNLRRLVTAGIPSPTPVEVRENVLVMTFLGDREGWASPRLKDAHIDKSAYPALYAELVLNVRKLFHQCKLVHADLSEYNILYHDEHLYIIDVSQSVEHDHPAAFDFLRSDLRNVDEFFARMGVQTLGVRRSFEFVIREHLDVPPEAAFEGLLAEAGMGDLEEASDNTAVHGDEHGSAAHEDAVFLQSYIPRSLNDLYDPERDADAAARGEGQTLIYADTIGLVDTRPPQEPSATHVRFATSVPEDAAPSENDTSEGDEGSEDTPDEEGEGAEGTSYPDRQPRGHRHEDREAKKVSPCGPGLLLSAEHAHSRSSQQERKKAVKAEQREKRKTKMPKAEKKRKMKTAR
ncbi:RIO1-domain-containing protein [Auriscalpium vulgare]|uniref:RIO1-domain-containing protein n=1 Tax=Auriscalpium vulgare TaxID=40419 RepID=A0ACB8S1Y6_9AGAM|nr:RIO1-domain-containing protein [Auriscalpium vulgare]